MEKISGTKKKAGNTLTEYMEQTKWEGLENWQLYDKQMDWIENALSGTIDLQLVVLKTTIPINHETLLQFDPKESLELYKVMMGEYKYLVKNGFANSYWDKRIKDFRDRISCLFNIVKLYRDVRAKELFKSLKGKKVATDEVIYNHIDKKAHKIYCSYISDDDQTKLIRRMN
jgi:hypothetical protein